MNYMNTHRLVTTDPLGDAEDGHILTQAIIDTIHEPLIVLDEDLRIIVASRSFYKKFKRGAEDYFFFGFDLFF
jgi:PAS domain-containing protein